MGMAASTTGAAAFSSTAKDSAQAAGVSAEVSFKVSPCCRNGPFKFARDASHSCWLLPITTGVAPLIASAMSAIEAFMEFAEAEELNGTEII